MELSHQMSSSFCEVKGLVKDSTNKLDDTMRYIDSQRLRDNLNIERNEVNMLKILSHSRSRSRSPSPQRHRENYYYPYPQNITQTQYPINNNIPVTTTPTV